MNSDLVGSENYQPCNSDPTYSLLSLQKNNKIHTNLATKLILTSFNDLLNELKFVGKLSTYGF